MTDSNPQDQDILRRINETEREADGLLREAEAEARSLREQARSKSAEMLRARKQEWEQRRVSLMAQRLEEARQEARRMVEAARAEAGLFKGQVEVRIPDVVEQLLKHLLPL
jgi:vacuolar-type H+-ATPase subunit H